MKNVVIIVAQNFQDEEFIYPYYRLQEEGYRVSVATPSGENMPGKYGVPARATMNTTNLNGEKFDAVILPGGFESPDRLRIRKEVTTFVKTMYEAGKLVAAICHGPWICISAKIVKGRKMTGYIAVSDDLLNAGAEYIDAPLVVDGNLITSPHYRNNPEFMKAVVDWINRN